MRSTPPPRCWGGKPCARGAALARERGARGPRGWVRQTTCHAVVADDPLQRLGWTGRGHLTARAVVARLRDVYRCRQLRRPWENNVRAAHGRVPTAARRRTSGHADGMARVCGGWGPASWPNGAQAKRRPGAQAGLCAHAPSGCAHETPRGAHAAGEAPTRTGNARARGHTCCHVPSRAGRAPAPAPAPARQSLCARAAPSPAAQVDVSSSDDSSDEEDSDDDWPSSSLMARLAQGCRPSQLAVGVRRARVVYDAAVCMVPKEGPPGRGRIIRKGFGRMVGRQKKKCAKAVGSTASSSVWRSPSQALAGAWHGQSAGARRARARAWLPPTAPT